MTEGVQVKRYQCNGSDDCNAPCVALVQATDFDALQAQLAEERRISAVLRDECRKADEAAEGWRRQFCDAQAQLAARDAVIAERTRERDEWKQFSKDATADYIAESALKARAEKERDTAQAALTAALEREGKLRAYVRHHPQCASRVHNFPPDGKTQGPCNCGLSALGATP
jgi:hypothetical protein